MWKKLCEDVLTAYTIPTKPRNCIPPTEQYYYSSTADLLQLHSKISRSSDS